MLITLYSNIGGVVFFTNDGLNNNPLGMSSSISTNTWYNVTLIREGNGITNGYKAYLNGSFTGSSNTGTWSATTTLWVGSRSDVTNQAFSGNIGTVLGYSRALTATEVLQNFNAQKARFGL